MPIVQSGALNTTALVVPDLYVQIVPPQNLVLNGVPTNVVGVVGSASWGPVNQPVIVATMADYSAGFWCAAGAKVRYGDAGGDGGAAGGAELSVRAGDGWDGVGGELCRVLFGRAVSVVVDGAVFGVVGEPDRAHDFAGECGGDLAVDAGVVWAGGGEFR